MKLVWLRCAIGFRKELYGLVFESSIASQNCGQTPEIYKSWFAFDVRGNMRSNILSQSIWITCSIDRNWNWKYWISCCYHVDWMSNIITFATWQCDNSDEAAKIKNSQQNPRFVASARFKRLQEREISRFERICKCTLSNPRLPDIIWQLQPFCTPYESIKLVTVIRTRIIA